MIITFLIIIFLLVMSNTYYITNQYGSGVSPEQFKELKDLLLNNKTQLVMANQKLDQINANLDTANATIAEVKGIVVNVDGDVNTLDADIQKLKDQLANGGTVTEADLDALLVKSQSVVSGIAELKASAGAVDDKTPATPPPPPDTV